MKNQNTSAIKRPVRYDAADYKIIQCRLCGEVETDEPIPLPCLESGADHSLQEVPYDLWVAKEEEVENDGIASMQLDEDIASTHDTCTICGDPIDEDDKHVYCTAMMNDKWRPMV